jgi:nucleotide-binding universal stress UspA family protein
MADRQHILVAINDFPMTQHLEDCLRKTVKDRTAVTIHLFHALGPLPPQLLESRGADDPTDEKKVEAEQIQQQESWFIRARQEAELLLQTATARLRDFLSDAEIKSHFVLLYQREDLVAEILKAAHHNDCATIIVGHKSYPWLREQFHAHTAVQLKSASPDVTVCAVAVNV